VTANASVKPGDRILIHGKTPAVIADVRGDAPLVVEAVYRHASGRIVAEDVVFANGEWAYRNFGSCASVNAETDPRLRRYAAALTDATG
jgi:hypothetical protein